MENRAIHLWETFEITLYAENKYENYYTEVCVWAVSYTHLTLPTT